MVEVFKTDVYEEERSIIIVRKLLGYFPENKINFDLQDCDKILRVLFMHASLDGYAAGTKGEMDWIHVDEEIFDYAAERTKAADTALYGRVTYEMMESYWPTAADKPDASKHDKEHSTWYNAVNKVVLSKSMQGQNLKNTIIISDNIESQIQDLKQKDGNEIIIFGSPSAAHSLMQLDLIDDYWLFVNPVLLGNGIPVFSNIQETTKLNLIASHSFSSGVVCLHYERAME